MQLHSEETNSSASPDTNAPPPTLRHNLPVESTPFIGRTQEVGEIRQLLLEDASHRLLTVVGPGGIGKTRLALEVARLMVGTFCDGVWFVPLAPLQTPDDLLPALADALDMRFQGADEPTHQLLRALRDKKLLLVLDNFEHLLAGVGLVAEILHRAPGVKVLATSRERLNLSGEIVYPLGGMAFPAHDLRQDIATHEAAQLLLERANALRPKQTLDALALRQVARICRLVQGMPLAIVLAAGWLEVLSLQEVADEIEQSLDFLETQMRDAPARQRSVRAAFTSSWKRLEAREQYTFMKLSVFRGGFTRQAAQEVAGATLPILRSLANKSLIALSPNGRYEIHELLRQYAADYLDRSGEGRRTRDAHSEYFADFLAARESRLFHSLQRQAIAEITNEFENVRTAWAWMVEQGQVASIVKAAAALDLFCFLQSRFGEGAALFERAIAQLKRQPQTQEVDEAMARLLVLLSWYLLRLGRLQEAEDMLLHCQAIYRRLAIPPLPGYGTDPRLALGALASIRGKHATALALFDEARRASERDDHLINRQVAYNMLAKAYADQGQYDKARQFAEEARAVAQQRNDDWFVAECLSHLGQIAQRAGDPAAAVAYLEAGYELYESLAYASGRAQVLNRLGDLAQEQGDSSRAADLYEKSLAINREINEQHGVIRSLVGLGQIAAIEGRCEVARRHLYAALRQALDSGHSTLVIFALLGVAHLYLHTERQLRGLEILALVGFHEAAEEGHRRQAQQLLDRVQHQFALPLFSATVQQGRTADPEQKAREVLADLAVPPTVP